MSVDVTPGYAARTYRDPAESMAYIRVRVPSGPRPDGSVLVYFPNGTGLVVNVDQLLCRDEL